MISAVKGNIEKVVKKTPKIKKHNPHNNTFETGGVSENGTRRGERPDMEGVHMES